ncbi:MurR/RpiR family transcriptional regulator [Listeria immobilis]|uniref:MurR/RpiR family transcriptional regulator n=1 Tax=Listeria immobilis TaxID=2713502 RepID=UPI0016270767|nr:MurR/RpiR family transcriptional regulator [Listeria immobilis]MBC1514682.1 MurR/RpiR family transcriptional regulator [Listeria immobilis]
MIFDKLRQVKHLTNTEQIIATFILEYPRIVVNISLEELSNQCHASQASIIRLCKKMGVKGFSDFKIKLASELTSFALDGNQISFDLPISKSATTEEIADTFYQLSIRSLEYEYKELNLSDIKLAAQLIHNADITYIYGRGESLIIAEDLHYKLIRLGLTSVLESMNGFQEAQSFNFEHHHQLNKTAIIISQYSNSHQVHYIIDELVTNNIPFILLTASDNAWPFDKLAKVTIRVHSSESRYKMGSFTSRTAMLYILDCIFGELFNISYDENSNNLFSFAKRKTERDYFYKKNHFD